MATCTRASPDQPATERLLHDYDHGSESSSNVNLHSHPEVCGSGTDRESGHHFKHRPWFRSSWLTISALLCSLAAFVAVLALWRHIDSTLSAVPQPESVLERLYKLGGTPEKTNTASWKDCGSDSSAARSKGCHYDLMLSAWIHADCFDAELMESYLKKHKYSWYADAALTTRLPDALIRKGDHVRIYVEPEFHYVHCAYMWEMQMRAWHKGRAIEHRIWELNHTIHCGRLLVEHALPRNYTRLTVAFDRCGWP